MVNLNKLFKIKKNPFDHSMLVVYYEQNGFFKQIKIWHETLRNTDENCLHRIFDDEHSVCIVVIPWKKIFDFLCCASCNVLTYFKHLHNMSITYQHPCDTISNSFEKSHKRRTDVCMPLASNGMTSPEWSVDWNSHQTNHPRIISCSYPLHCAYLCSFLLQAIVHMATSSICSGSDSDSIHAFKVLPP